ncbi:hypothetical protein [Salibacterium lacus]|uniref:Uncharacterized protein n=1 Tax=Salibacterium lacus TaxID=1898109 RepID=A0ABW5T2R8_9BACI
MQQLNEWTQGWASIILYAVLLTVMIYFSLSLIFKNRGRYVLDIATVMIEALIILVVVPFIAPPLIGGWQALGILFTAAVGIMISVLFTIIKVAVLRRQKHFNS